HTSLSTGGESGKVSGTSDIRFELNLRFRQRLDLAGVGLGKTISLHHIISVKGKRRILALFINCSRFYANGLAWPQLLASGGLIPHRGGIGLCSDSLFHRSKANTMEGDRITRAFNMLMNAASFQTRGSMIMAVSAAELPIVVCLRSPKIKVRRVLVTLYLDEIGETFCEVLCTRVRIHNLVMRKDDGTQLQPGTEHESIKELEGAILPGAGADHQRSLPVAAEFPSELQGRGCFAAAVRPESIVVIWFRFAHIMIQLENGYIKRNHCLWAFALVFVFSSPFRERVFACPSVSLNWNVMSSAKVYVGNLSWNTTDDTLRQVSMVPALRHVHTLGTGLIEIFLFCQVFSDYGHVADSIVMRDRDTGRSRGFGFVAFSNDQEAQVAITQLNEQELDGRRIKVNLVNVHVEGGGYFSGDGGGGGGYSQNNGDQYHVEPASSPVNTVPDSYDTQSYYSPDHYIPSSQSIGTYGESDTDQSNNQILNNRYSYGYGNSRARWPSRNPFQVTGASTSAAGGDDNDICPYCGKPRRESGQEFVKSTMHTASYQFPGGYCECRIQPDKRNRSRSGSA
ncbi:glycine-rich rna binding protein, partial [Moniliophthora roreri]